MFYKHLKNICVERGTSPSAVAIAIGISKSNVTRWKKGGNPGMAILLKIAHLLDISVDELIPKK